MATVVSTPAIAYRASLIGGTAMGQSANLTIATTALGWEARIGFQGAQPNTANLSAGWEAYAYRSWDGGNTYETVASVGMSIARNPNINDRKVMILPHGYWLLRIISGGGSASTWSFQIGTIEDITAVINV